MLLPALLPVTAEGAELFGNAGLVGGGINCGGCSSPTSVDALMGVGSAGLAASIGLCAKAFVDKELRPSAWLRIKPIVVICERRKRALVI